MNCNEESSGAGGSTSNINEHPPQIQLNHKQRRYREMHHHHHDRHHRPYHTVKHFPVNNSPAAEEVACAEDQSAGGLKHQQSQAFDGTIEPQRLFIENRPDERGQKKEDRSKGKTDHTSSRSTQTITKKSRDVYETDGNVNKGEDEGEERANERDGNELGHNNGCVHEEGKEKRKKNDEKDVKLRKVKGEHRIVSENMENQGEELFGKHTKNNIGDRDRKVSIEKLVKLPKEKKRLEKWEKRATERTHEETRVNERDTPLSLEERERKKERRREQQEAHEMKRNDYQKAKRKTEKEGTKERNNGCIKDKKREKGHSDELKENVPIIKARDDITNQGNDETREKKEKKRREKEKEAKKVSHSHFQSEMNKNGRDEEKKNRLRRSKGKEEASCKEYLTKDVGDPPRHELVLGREAKDADSVTENQIRPVGGEAAEEKMGKGTERTNHRGSSARETRKLTEEEAALRLQRIFRGRLVRIRSETHILKATWKILEYDDGKAMFVW